jgi:rifampicin phosphotransferase
MTAESAAPNAVASAPIPADFPIAWPDPADERLTWELDDMHMPFAITPLAIDYIETLASGFNPVYVEWGLPLRIRLLVFHGYGFFALDPGTPEGDIAAVMERRSEANRVFMRDNDRYWREDALPQLKAAERQIGGIDVDGLPGHELARSWDEAWSAAGRAWAIHFKAIRGAYQVTEDLADLYEKAVPGAPANEAVALIQGENTTLQEVEAGIERLADLAVTLPAVHARLGRAPTPSLDELEVVEDGAGFVGETRRFLEQHGHLGQPFDDLALPSWGEQPEILIGEIAQRIKHPPERAADRVARLQRNARTLAEGVRKRLAGDPETLARFEDLLELARTIGPLTEVHNYWIDRLTQARVRALAFRVADRLVREGSIGTADDILYLRRGEIRDAIVEPRDLRALVAERRAEHAHQLTLKPPRVLGKPLDPDEDYGRFDSLPRDQGSTSELKGVGASAGVVRGPARVALGPDDFGRIEPGDVIVCPSSNPSWVPVFAIAGGLVTNTGGVLAHAAVVAREFGLPAVVGVTGATTLIADGRTVEIDGTAGTVRLL